MNFKKIFNLGVLFGFISIIHLVSAQEISLSEAHYRIYSTKLNEVIDIEKIVEDFKGYDVLLFGEEHDDSVAHYLEHRLLEKLYNKYDDLLVLSLEMFDRDVQVMLDEYLSGKITEKYFIKDTRVWKNYKDYRPMIEFAKDKQITVIAANAPFRYANMARRKGQEFLKSLSETAKSFIAPLPYDTATGAHYEKLMRVVHNMPMPTTKKDTVTTDTPGTQKMPSLAMPSFSINQGQSLWNATMAYSIYEYLKKNRNRKIMHINGKFHSDEFFGIPEQLKKYEPKIRYLVISALSDSSFPEIDFGQYKKLADYIIITDPSVP
jgi:uncharacterized iron-regulated protein